MNSPVETILVAAAALPGLYAFICWARRNIHAGRMAKWARETHRDQWESLHWLGRAHGASGIEVLITKGLISGPEVNKFRARDDYLEKATWVGLLISALLLLVIALLKFIGSLLG
jgi:hypothetical protein